MSAEEPPTEAATVGDGEGTASVIPVPDYDFEQFVPQPRPLTEYRRNILRREFGYTRAYYKARPHKHYALQRKLNQGRYGTTYDVYLTRSVRYATVAALLGLLVGGLLGYAASSLGLLDGLGFPVALPTTGLVGDVVLFVAENKAILGGATLAVTISVLATLAVWYGRYYHPFYFVDNRRRQINITLPHVIVYMYALSFGGMDLVEVFKRAAAADNIYGEAAKEFDMVVTDMEFFGNDIYTALRNARNLTPSDNMERFFDDLISVLDSGGDVTTFLQAESRKYMDEAVNEQESFLDTLETLSEVFVV
ncbi:MAG: type II secretion system F family protein, partial [Halodesulfurarchaeum sp.]